MLNRLAVCCQALIVHELLLVNIRHSPFFGVVVCSGCTPKTHDWTIGLIHDSIKRNKINLSIKIIDN